MLEPISAGGLLRGIQAGVRMRSGMDTAAVPAATQVTEELPPPALPNPPALVEPQPLPVELQQPIASPDLIAPPGAAADPQPPTRPLLYRVGRAVLRNLRPLFLPLLHRFDWRVRTAVVNTGLVDAVTRLESAVSRIEAEVGKAPIGLNPVLQILDTLTHRQIVQMRELTSLGTRLDEMDMALRARADTMLRQAADFSRNTGDLSKNYDAQRVQSDMFHQRVDMLLGDAGSLLASMKDLPATSEYILQRTDALLSQSGNLAERSDLLLNRTNSLLNRVVLANGDAFLARTPFGWLLTPAKDAGTLVALYESDGVLEPGTVIVVEALLGPGDIAIDVGANIGLILLPMARRVGPQGRVIAVEPTPELVRLLHRTVALNGLAQTVTVQECAAGQAVARLVFNVAPVSGHSSLLALETVTEKIEVDVRPLDDLVAAGTRIALIKLDVEGFELPAWRGMRRIVADSPDLAVIVEFGPLHLVRAGETIEDWLATLTEPGFTAYEIDERTGACRPLRTTGLAAIFSVNLLLLRHPPSRYPKLRFE